MRILTHDELPQSFDSQIALLNLGTGWGIFDFNRIKLARESGYPSTDYYGVYAVEDEEPVARVEAIHIKVETIKGPETVCGICGVVTRRDKSSLGLAKKLLNEVHRREREAGIKHSLLWTGRNNKAHNIYESLGYIDIFDPGVALIKLEKDDISLPEDLKIRVAKTDDADLIDDLHTRMTANRLGFIYRFRDFTKLMFRFGFEKPDTFRIFTRKDDIPIGYAQIEQNPLNWFKSSEVIINEEYFMRVIISLELEAKGSWLAFSNSFISDARSLLTKRGYNFGNYTYTTLMACNLDSQESETNFLRINDLRFICHGRDHF